jgi:hypothetical protein
MTAWELDETEPAMPLTPWSSKTCLNIGVMLRRTMDNRWMHCKWSDRTRVTRSPREAEPIISKTDWIKRSGCNSLFEREAISAETDYENVADEMSLLQNLTVPADVQSGPYDLSAVAWI